MGLYELLISAQFFDTIFNGILSNRADYLFTSTANRVFNKIKGGIQKPETQEIQKAVRKAYLEATYIACKTYKEKNYKLIDRVESKGPGHIDKILNYIIYEVKTLSKVTVKEVPQNFFDENYESLLKGQDGDNLAKKVLELKEQVILELEKQGLFVESGLNKAIIEGWNEDDKEIDWYELMKACFANELNSNSRLSASIESELLLNLEDQINNLDVTLKDIQKHLNISLDYSQNILSKLNDLELKVQAINAKLSDLPDEIIDKIKDLFSLLNAENIPNFQLDKKYNSLKADLNEVTKEEVEIQQEIEDWKAELTESDSTEKTLRCKRRLGKAEEQFIEVSRKKLELQKEQESYIHNVLSLASIIYQENNNESPRLKRAKEKFKEGQYEEANNILDEKEIDQDINQSQEKIKNYAVEYFIKAKVTELNKKNDWFRLTVKYYKKSIDTFSNFIAAIEFALFLQNNNQAADAVKYYLLALTLADDKEKKALILNNLGNLISIDDPETAAKYLKEALDIREKLAERNHERFIPFVAVTLNNLGKTQFHFDPDSAEISHFRALEIRRKLTKKSPEVYQSHLIETLNNLGILYAYKKNDPDSAKDFYNEAVYSLLKIKNFKSLKDTHQKAGTYLNYGIFKAKNGECNTAGKYFTAAVILFRKLSEINSYACLPNLAISLVQRGAFLNDCKEDYHAALKCYDEAINYYRSLSKHPQYRVYLAYVLCNYGKLLMDTEKNDQDKMVVSLNEALQIQKELAKSNPTFHLPYIAKTLLYLSYAYLLEDNEFMEKKCQDEHSEIIKKLPNDNLPPLYMNIDNVFD